MYDWNVRIIFKDDSVIDIPTTSLSKAYTICDRFKKMEDVKIIRIEEYYVKVYSTYLTTL